MGKILDYMDQTLVIIQNNSYLIKHFPKSIQVNSMLFNLIQPNAKKIRLIHSNLPPLHEKRCFFVVYSLCDRIIYTRHFIDTELSAQTAPLHSFII